MTITFFQSTTSITPILFVNFGQQAAGTIDFTMISTVEDSGSIDANVNFYNIDPFNSPYHPFNATTSAPPVIANDDSNDCLPCQPECYDKTGCQAIVEKYVKVYDDKIVINGWSINT